MITHHETSEQCTCKKCGSLRFRHEQLYEVRDSNNPAFDVSYDLFNRQEAIVCADCGTIYDQSAMGRVIGVFKQRI